MTTPEFRTWSRMSSSEISSSPPLPISTTPFPLLAIGRNERVRRPGPRVFDAMRVRPLSGIFFQNGVELVALLARDEIGRLKLKIALRAAEFSTTHLVQSDGAQGFCEGLEFRIRLPFPAGFERG